MWERAAIYPALIAAAAGVWYFFFCRYNRREGTRTVRWIDSALAGKGQIVAVHWLGAALCELKLRLDRGPFHRPKLTIRLSPRQMPVRWLRHRWRGDTATITWQADLDVPPAFDLEVGRHRWSARSRKRLLPKPTQWTFQPVTPLILTSRRNWPREVISMMNVLLSSVDCPMLSVGFRSSSPHFSAVIPLAWLSPDAGGGEIAFEMMRELAAEASASRR
jgi:hypothetical protein